MGTTERVEVLQGSLTFTRPVWSPDGKWIATQTEDGLVRVSSDGGKPEVLSTATVPILAVTWRSDSRRLVALSESDTPGHFSMIEIDANSKGVQVLNPDLGAIPIANQPIRGFSFIADQGFLTSLASARSDIWLLEGFQPPQRSLFWRPR
jgi:WD40 repeat protein